MFEHLVGMGGCIIINCARFLNNKKFEKFWNIFYSLILLDIILLIFPIFLTVNCKRILEILGFQEELVIELPKIIKILFFMKVLENINSILMSLIII